jgi:hypothetical protein
LSNSPNRITSPSWRVALRLAHEVFSGHRIRNSACGVVRFDSIFRGPEQS